MEGTTSLYFAFDRQMPASDLHHSMVRENEGQDKMDKMKHGKHRRQADTERKQWFKSSPLVTVFDGVNPFFTDVGCNIFLSKRDISTVLPA